MDADELSKEHAWSDIDDCVRWRYRQADSLSNPFQETKTPVYIVIVIKKVAWQLQKGTVKEKGTENTLRYVYTYEQTKLAKTTQVGKKRVAMKETRQKKNSCGNRKKKGNYQNKMKQQTDVWWGMVEERVNKKRVPVRVRVRFL